MSNYRINDFERYASAFRALSNPHRLAVFRRLMTCCQPGTVCSLEQVEGLSVGELGHDLDIAPSTLSHHLRELIQAKLIASRRDGKRILCWIEPAVLEDMATFFQPGNPSSGACCGDDR